MNILENFRDAGFVEQTKALTEIEKNSKFEAIPELFELHEIPLNDQAVDSMVTHTLRTLLTQKEEEAIKGIHSESKKIKKLCAHMAGENQFQSAGPVLMEQASKEKDPEVLFEILSSLSKIRKPEFLDIFRNHVRNPDQNISALCIEILGLWGDIESFDLISEIVVAGADDDKYATCDLVTWNAIKSVAALRTDKAMSFLVSQIAHRSPTVRRIIHQELAQKGRATISFLLPVFWEEDVDAKIHAAQLLGMIGEAKAADVLVSALSSGSADHPNIKLTIFEALGKIHTTKGTQCLLSSLSEENDLLLMGVVTALNRRVDPEVAEKIGALIQSEDDQGKRIVKAIVTSKALNIFEALYENKEAVAELLVAIPKSKDPVIITAFRAKLKSMKSGKLTSQIEKVPTVFAEEAGKRVLAVDDSRILLFFYRTNLSKMGLKVTTAINGQEAIDIMEKGEEFDLIITDLNMPVMDGIEFTREVRAHPVWKNIKVIMATTESKQSQIDLAKKVGVTDFVHKPFTDVVFQEKIRGFL